MLGVIKVMAVLLPVPNRAVPARATFHSSGNRPIANERDAKTIGDYIQCANHYARFVRH
jgi:hypothetical protein